ncbi:MAG: nuclear transport factor 2 family protein, partial [Lutibacter sp.]
MKRISLLILIITIVSCNRNDHSIKDESQEKALINSTLNEWHKNAAAANFKSYFDKMDSQSNFIGTEAQENWNKKAFEKFSKPFFDKGKAWNFKPLKRNIYIDEAHHLAWFDEILDTWMGVCRGSGVVIKKGNVWKIKHYVLS